MGQVQWGNHHRGKSERQGALRVRKADENYIMAISNPIFLDWEHRVEGREPKFDSGTKSEAFPVQIDDHLFISNASGASNLDQIPRDQSRSKCGGSACDLAPSTCLRSSWHSLQDG